MAKLSSTRIYGDLYVDGNTNLVGSVTGKISNAVLADKATILATARTLTIGNTGKTFDGSKNVSWSLAEIGAVNKAGDTMTGNLTINKTSATEAKYHFTNTSVSGWVGIGSGGTRYGLYSSTKDKYLIHMDGDNTYIGGTFMTFDADGDATIAKTLKVTGAITATAGITSGGNISSDTAVTDNLGSATKAWNQLYIKTVALRGNSTDKTYGALLVSTVGTTSVVGETILRLGNNVASGTDNNAKGKIEIYTSSAAHSAIVPGTNIGNITLTLPSATGTLARTADNVASATKLQTARTLTIGATGKTFDGTANVSWTAAEMGVVRGDNKSATTAATSQWYRVASTTTTGHGAQIGMFFIKGKVGSNHCHALVTVGTSHGQNPTIQQLAYTRWTSGALTKARIVYLVENASTTAHLEVYSKVEQAVPIEVEMIGANGWVLIDPNTVGSIPEGYQNKEITFTPDKIIANFQGPLTGNADSATKLKTARTLTIGNTGKTFDGSANVTWTLAELGVSSSSHTHTSSMATDLSGLTVSLNDYKITTNTPKIAYYFCPTDGNGANITGRPNDNDKKAFFLEVKSLRWVSATDYRCMQTYIQGTQSIIYVRYCNSGTWSAWEKVYTSVQKPTSADIGAATSGHGHDFYVQGTSSSRTTDQNGNANDISKSGFYRVSNTAGDANPFPDSNHSHILHGQHPSTANYKYQIAIPYSVTNKIYFRNNPNSTWGSWHRIYHTGDKPTYSDVGAAAASHKHGLLHDNLTVTLADTTTDSGWSMFNSTYNGFILKSVRLSGSTPTWGAGAHGSGIIFGGADTKGLITTSYSSPVIKFAGGNGTKPVWWLGLSGTTGTTYNLATMTTNIDNKLPLAGGTMTGSITFSDSGNTSGAFKGIIGTCGTNDGWRVGGSQTASNAGYLEIATRDDSNEPIYVRQYSGSFATLTRTLTLLDANGNTSMPGKLIVSGETRVAGKVTVNGNRAILGGAYHYGNGVLLKVCNTSTSTMVTIKITGNSYSTDTPPIDSTYQFYSYGANGITAYNAVNNGLHLGNMTVYRYDGNTYAWIKQTTNYQTLAFEVIYGATVPDLATYPTMSNSAVHTGTEELPVTNTTTITPQCNGYVKSITKSLNITTDWMDTGISGTNIATGSYMVQVIADFAGSGGIWQEYFTGVMSWFSSGTNSTETDEILLHKAGHAPNGNHLYLRVKRNSSGTLSLQISAEKAIGAAKNVVFKFKKLI